jgi:lipopolysaccharide cholinephosphotransferase
MEVAIIIFILLCIITMYINNKDLCIDDYSTYLSYSDIIDLKNGQKIMTDMFMKFDRICRKHNINYWCIYGTLLGVQRHRDWIPHDGDIDLGIEREDYEKFKLIQNELPNDMGFTEEPKKPCGKLRSKRAYYKYTEWGNNWDVNKGLQIDLFVYDKKEPHLLKLYSWETWNYNDIFPLREQYFSGIKVFIPNNPDIYLRTTYGNDYMTPLPRVKRYPHEGIPKIL